MLETISLIGFGKALVAPLVRSVGGWASNSFKDGVVSDFELSQLGHTVVRISVLTAGVYFGLAQLLDVDMDVLASGMAALVIDFLLPKKKK